MDKEKLMSILADAEFVLFSIKNEDRLHVGEVENAHRKLYKLMNVLAEKSITIE